MAEASHERDPCRRDRPIEERGATDQDELGGDVGARLRCTRLQRFTIFRGGCPCLIGPWACAKYAKMGPEPWPMPAQDVKPYLGSTEDQLSHRQGCPATSDARCATQIAWAALATSLLSDGRLVGLTITFGLHPDRWAPRRPQHRSTRWRRRTQTLLGYASDRPSPAMRHPIGGLWESVCRRRCGSGSERLFERPAKTDEAFHHEATGPGGGGVRRISGLNRARHRRVARLWPPEDVDRREEPSREQSQTRQQRSQAHDHLRRRALPAEWLSHTALFR